MRGDPNWWTDDWWPEAVKTAVSFIFLWLLICLAAGVSIGLVWGTARWIIGAH